MTQVMFFHAPLADVLAEWLWIALWIYVGMRYERYRWKKREETARSIVSTAEPTLGDPVSEAKIGDWKL